VYLVLSAGLFLRLDSLNIAWTNMSRDAVVYLVTSLPPTVTRLNLSGCRDTLHDEGKRLCLLVVHMYSLNLFTSMFLCLRQQYMVEASCFPVVHLAGCPLTPVSHDVTSLISGEVSMKRITNIHHLSGHC